jgi:O-succinylbenzoic acid--CoA ligase
LTDIVSPIKIAVQQYSNSAALIDNRQTILYSDLLDKILNITANLRDLDILPGSRVAITAEPSADYILLLLALLSYPAVACPISTRNPEIIIKKQIDRIKPKLLINEKNIKDIIKKNSNPLQLPDKLSLNNEASIIFSSGTTGDSKAVIHTLGNHYYSALGSNENIQLQTGDRWLLSLPLYHVSGMAIVYRCILAGATIVLPEENYGLSDFIFENKITHLSVVSSQLKKLVESPVEKLTQLKAILLGGESIPCDLINASYEKKLPVFTTYGMTETTSQLTTTAPNDNLEKLKTSGRPLNYREVKIDESNEILVRGEVLFKSYLDSGNIFDSDGWFRTGDIGSIDDDGYLTVMGRKDNMFISGGENIYPEMIEQALQQSEFIENVVVVPVSDDTFGQRPVAFVKLKNDNIDLKKIENFLSEKLPRFMLPIKYYDFPSDHEKSGLKISRSFFVKLAQKLKN